jgi:hypothetical protein
MGLPIKATSTFLTTTHSPQFWSGLVVHGERRNVGEAMPDQLSDKKT